MKRLNAMSATIAETDRLDAEVDATIAFFGALKRHRQEIERGARQRRRNRIRRASR